LGLRKLPKKVKVRLKWVAYFWVLY